MSTDFNFDYTLTITMDPTCIPMYIYDNISLNSQNDKCFRQTW